jgi:hypothetical protein
VPLERLEARPMGILGRYSIEVLDPVREQLH